MTWLKQLGMTPGAIPYVCLYAMLVWTGVHQLSVHQLNNTQYDAIQTQGDQTKQATT